MAQTVPIGEVDKARAKAIALAVEKGGVAPVDVRIERASRVDAAQIKAQVDR